MHTKHSHSFDQNIRIFLCFFPKTLLVLDFTLSKIMVLNIARTATLHCSIILVLTLHVLIKVLLKRSNSFNLSEKQQNKVKSCR